MRIRGTCLLALGLLLAQAALRAQDNAYTIKVREPAKGEVVLVERTEEVNSQNKVVDGNGKALQDQINKGVISATYRETILEQEGKKRPTKLRRDYEKAQLKTDGKTVDQAFHGKSVLIEKQKTGKYAFTLDGGKALTGADAESLEKEFNGDGGDDKFDLEKHLLPKNAVKLNDTWKIDMEAMAKDFASNTKVEVDLAKAAGTGKLKKVYEKDGRQFGELHFVVELPLKSLPGAPGMKLALQAGSKATIDVTLDVCIDGASVAGTLKGNMKMDILASLPLPDGTTAKLTGATQFNNSVTKKEAKK